MPADERPQMDCRSSYVISKISVPVTPRNINFCTIELLDSESDSHLFNLDSQRQVAHLGPLSRQHNASSEAPRQVSPSISNSMGISEEDIAAVANERNAIVDVPMQYLK